LNVQCLFISYFSFNILLDISDCSRRCAESSTCKGFTFLKNTNPKKCQLKKLYAAEFFGGSITTSETEDYGELWSDPYESSECSMKPYDHTCAQRDDTDMDTGADLAERTTEDISSCQRFCSNTKNCKSFVWVSNTYSEVNKRKKCYLKTKKVGDDSAPALIGDVGRTYAEPPSSQGKCSSPCNRRDHVGKAGSDLPIYIKGGQFNIQNTLEACVRDCANTAKCEAINWFTLAYPEVNKRGRCEKKTKQGRADIVDLVPLLEVIYAEPSNDVGRCGSGVCNFRPDTDFLGYNLKHSDKTDTMEECSRVCANNKDCYSFIWINKQYLNANYRTVCIIKSTVPGNGNDASLTFQFGSEYGEPMPASGRCGVPLCKEKENKNLSGNDLRAVKKNTQKECSQWCAQAPECQSYLYVNENYHNGTLRGQCRLKSTRIDLPGAPALTNVTGVIYGEPTVSNGRCDQFCSPKSDVDINANGVFSVPSSAVTAGAITVIKKETQKLCARHCAETPNCESFIYNSVDFATVSERKECHLKTVRANAGATFVTATSAVGKLYGEPATRSGKCGTICDKRQQYKMKTSGAGIPNTGLTIGEFADVVEAECGRMCADNFGCHSFNFESSGTATSCTLLSLNATELLNNVTTATGNINLTMGDIMQKSASFTYGASTYTSEDICPAITTSTTTTTTSSQTTGTSTTVTSTTTICSDFVLASARHTCAGSDLQPITNAIDCKTAWRDMNMRYHWISPINYDHKEEPIVCVSADQQSGIFNQCSVHIKDGQQSASKKPYFKDISLCGTETNSRSIQTGEFNAMCRINTNDTQCNTTTTTTSTPTTSTSTTTTICSDFRVAVAGKTCKDDDLEDIDNKEDCKTAWRDMNIQYHFNYDVVSGNTSEFADITSCDSGNANSFKGLPLKCSVHFNLPSSASGNKTKTPYFKTPSVAACAGTESRSKIKAELEVGFQDLGYTNIQASSPSPNFPTNGTVDNSQKSYRTNGGDAGAGENWWEITLNQAETFTALIYTAAHQSNDGSQCCFQRSEGVKLYVDDVGCNPLKDTDTGPGHTGWSALETRQIDCPKTGSKVKIKRNGLIHVTELRAIVSRPGTGGEYRAMCRKNKNTLHCPSTTSTTSTTTSATNTTTTTTSSSATTTTSVTTDTTGSSTSSVTSTTSATTTTSITTTTTTTSVSTTSSATTYTTNTSMTTTTSTTSSSITTTTITSSTTITTSTTPTTSTTTSITTSTTSTTPLTCLLHQCPSSVDNPARSNPLLAPGTIKCATGISCTDEHCCRPSLCGVYNCTNSNEFVRNVTHNDRSCTTHVPCTDDRCCRERKCHDFFCDPIFHWLPDGAMQDRSCSLNGPTADVNAIAKSTDIPQCETDLCCRQRICSDITCPFGMEGTGSNCMGDCGVEECCQLTTTTVTTETTHSTSTSTSSTTYTTSSSSTTTVTTTTATTTTQTTSTTTTTSLTTTTSTTITTTTTSVLTCGGEFFGKARTCPHHKIKLSDSQMITCYGEVCNDAACCIDRTCGNGGSDGKLIQLNETIPNYVDGGGRFKYNSGTGSSLGNAFDKTYCGHDLLQTNLDQIFCTLASGCRAAECCLPRNCENVFERAQHLTCPNSDVTGQPMMVAKLATCSTCGIQECCVEPYTIVTPAQFNLTSLPAAATTAGREYHLDISAFSKRFIFIGGKGCCSANLMISGWEAPAGLSLHECRGHCAKWGVDFSSSSGSAYSGPQLCSAISWNKATQKCYGYTDCGRDITMEECPGDVKGLGEVGWRTYRQVASKKICFLVLT